MFNLKSSIFLSKKSPLKSFCSHLDVPINSSEKGGALFYNFHNKSSIIAVFFLFHVDVRKTKFPKKTYVPAFHIWSRSSSSKKSCWLKMSEQTSTNALIMNIYILLFVCLFYVDSLTYMHKYFPFLSSGFSYVAGKEEFYMNINDTYHLLNFNNDC